MMKSIILLQLMFTLYGLLHASFGQYFYVPFLTENSEMHTGRRPKDSIYSGGYTDWQDHIQAQIESYSIGGKAYRPKLWYGWLGRDRRFPARFASFFFTLINKIFRKIRKWFRRK